MFVAISPSEAQDRARKHTMRRPHNAAGRADEAPRLQRSFGAASLRFELREGISHAARVYQEGAVKVRFPNVAAGRAPEAVLLNMAGGMTGGDRQDIAVEVGPGARTTVTTQSCERIYRSSGDDASMLVCIAAAPEATLEWMPQPLILFDGGRLKRETHVDVSTDATLLAIESIILGRAASGEVVEYGALSDAWSIRRAGRLIHVERFAADGGLRATLAKPMVLGEHRAMATLRYVAPDAEGRVGEMRAILADSPIVCAASAWNGMLIARFLAPDGYALTGELVRVLQAFRNASLPRTWML
jgi:urease accessory protein